MSLTGLGSLAADPQTPGGSAPAPAFVVGQREYLDSRALGERREILVSVPSVAPDEKLPLLVALDGERSSQAAGSLTVSAWIRPRVPAAYTAWISHTRSIGWGSKWRLGFGRATTAEWGATTLAVRWTDYWTTKAAISANEWVQTAEVFDQTLGTIALYLDGRLVEEFWGLTPWSASSGPLLIGAQRDDGVFYNGDVGEVRVYNRTLSAAEIAALHALE